jgi:two-component system sensor histidine kinase ChiS
MNRNLSSDFKKISFIILIAAFIISFVTSVFIYIIDNRKREKSYFEIAEEVDSILIYEFTHTEHYAIFLGRKILQIGASNISQISALMREESLESINNVFSWTYFDWINGNNKLIANSNQGILPSPIDLSGRKYLEKTKSFPWKLVLSEPVMGVPGGEYIIPSGLGVEDRDGRYIGTVGIEFSIKKIRDKLIHAVADYDSEFFVLDESNDILVSSLELITLNNNFFKNRHYFVEDQGLIKNTQKYNDNVELKYQCSSKYYPFKIIIAENKNLRLQLFIEAILPKLLTIFSVAGISIYLLMSLRNKIIIPLTSLLYMLKGKEKIDVLEGDFITRYQEISQLASSISKIKNFNTMLKDEVTKRTLYLKQALQAKQEFLNNIGHEVRTPLQGILGISSELNKRWDKINDVDKRKYVKIMADSGDRLMQLMSNILDLSRFEEGKMSFNFKLCEFKKIVYDSIMQIRPLLESKPGLKLKVSYDKQIKTKIKCDRLRIQQVINNLLNNAIKYSNAGTICIKVKNLDSNLLFSISDEGIGIPPKELEVIFQPFVESSKTKTKAGGKGLGLALCKEIITKHDGKIWAENNLKKGSSFYFTLPFKRISSRVVVTI